MLVAIFIATILPPVLAGLCDQTYTMATQMNPADGSNPLPNLMDNWNTNYQVPPGPWGNLSNDPFPNGFRSAEFFKGNNPPFCLTVDKTANTMVKVLIQAYSPQARICVADQDYDPKAPDSALAPICANGVIDACFGAKSISNFKLMVFCEGQCNEEADVSFFYKVRNSQLRNSITESNSAQENIDMWCMNIVGDPENTFPKQLNVGTGIAANVQLPTDAPGAINAATGTPASFVFLAVASYLLVFLV